MKGLLYQPEQLHKEQEFLAYIQSQDFPADCILLPICQQDEKVCSLEKKEPLMLAVESLLKEYQLEPTDVLWLVTSSKEQESARALSIPTLCYGMGISYENAWMVVEGLEEVDATFLERVYRRERHLPWEILETSRCYVRELTISDLPALYALYAKPGVTDFMEDLYPLEEEEAYEKSYIENIYRYYGYGMWLVFEKQTNRLIGRAGIEPREYGEEFANELGYMIDPDYQNRGYATEVCQAIITYAKKELELGQLNCLIDPQNKASIAFIFKLGFRFTETVLVSLNPMNRYILY